MAIEIGVQYKGQLRCEATRQKTGKTVLTDVGADHGGQDDYFSPVDLAGAALGTCAMSMIALVAERDGLDVSSMRTSVQLEMVTSPARRIGSANVTVTLPKAIPDSVRPKLQAAANACPVKNSLHPDIQIRLEFVYV